MDIKFQIKEIQNLLIDFCRVTGHQIALFDRKGENLIRYPQKGNTFCEAIQSVHEGKKRCESCDKYGIQKAISTGDLCIYNCHAGLLEICLPVKLNKYDDEILGFMMIGHLLDSQDSVNYQWNNVCNKCRDILPNIFMMYDSFQDMKPVSQEYIIALCNMLKSCVSYIAYERLIIQAGFGLWERLHYFIIQNATEKLSLAEIASALSVSVSTLTRCAVENTGDTVGTLLLRERLNLACDYLKSTDLPITEVAKKSGIPDYNYFSRVFKKQMGTSPRQFRQL